MELKIKREWLASHLDVDEGHDFTAGSFFQLGEELPEVRSQNQSVQDAFGALVQLWRLDQMISVQKLAEIANVDEQEIEDIERNSGFRPEARTVTALAELMEVPESKLLQLSGNLETEDPRFAEQSSLFVANVRQWQRISDEQRELLSSYITYLAAG